MPRFQNQIFILMSKSLIVLAFVLIATTLLGFISLYTSPALACWGGFISILIFFALVDELSGKKIIPVIGYTHDASKLPSVARLRATFMMFIAFFIAGFYGFFQARGSLMPVLGVSEALKNIFVAIWAIELCCIIGFFYRMLCKRIWSVRMTKGIMERLKPLDL